MFLKKIVKKCYLKIKRKIEITNFKKFDEKLDNLINKDFLKKFKKRKKLRFFVDSKNKEKIKEIFKQGFSNRVENVLQNADEICEHNFNLLGSGKVNLGKKINWHCDFKSGYYWDPKTFYLDIKYGGRERADVKIPWELSRFQHLATLGETYWLTGNEKYTKEFINEIENWIENNHPQYGVNWRCTMDVAIRTCNWVLGYYFFKDSKEVTDEFLMKFSKSLLIHGEHIQGNLEKNWRGFTSNHYFSDVVGLVYLGIFFNNTNIGYRWLNFGIKELKKEMKKQVYPDGCDFEASTCYHRLVLELFFFSTLFIVINNEKFNGENYREITERVFDKEYTERFYKMFEAVLYLLKPNGRMPQIGDNDNGRLHVFTNREILDMRYLLTFGAIFFKEPKFKVKEFGFSKEALWIFGEKGYKIWKNLKENYLLNIKSKAFPDAGWYIIRNNKDYCIVSCGPNGQNGNGGHCHNDKLSFELMIDREDIIVDPGTYLYTPSPEWRNKFRSTYFHNTVVVDDQEQNRFIENNLFSLKNDAICECLDFGEDNEKIYFIGEHYGYKRLKDPVIHKREIRLYKNKKRLEVIDEFNGKEERNLRWNFVLPPKQKKDININFISPFCQSKKTSFYSPQYGVKDKNNKISISIKTKTPFKMRITIDK